VKKVNSDTVHKSTKSLDRALLQQWPKCQDQSSLMPGHMAPARGKACFVDRETAGADQVDRAVLRIASIGETLVPGSQSSTQGSEVGLDLAQVWSLAWEMGFQHRQYCFA